MSEEVTVRFYAGAADAAGTQSIAIALDGESTSLDDFLQALPQAVERSTEASGAHFSRVCDYSSFLINAVQAKRTTASLSSGDTLDILPPFAGG